LLPPITVVADGIPREYVAARDVRSRETVARKAEPSVASTLKIEDLYRIVHALVNIERKGTDSGQPAALGKKKTVEEPAKSQ